MLPTSAKVAVIGGGVIGTSIAYHLAKGGCTDVVLVERDALTSGTTWHAAGLMVTYGSTSETSIRMRQYSKELYRALPLETGLETGFKPVGFIELASNPDYLVEHRRISGFNRSLGVEVEELSPDQVQQLFPLANKEGLLAGFHVADDGRVDPVSVTQALAKGARNRGAKIYEGVTALGVDKKNGAVHRLRTDKGNIECHTIVNCCGMWARQFAADTGILAPLQAAEHYYLLTDPIDGVSRSWPVLEDPGHYGYYREEAGGLLVGLFEPKCAPWSVGRIPMDASFTSITPDWERMTPYLQHALHRVPRAASAGVKQLFCGPESFTPDLSPLVGEVPELKNYFIAAGLNSIGILSAGGLGRILAHWILEGRPDVDITSMNVARMHPCQATPAYLEARVVEVLGKVYGCNYPDQTAETSRGQLVSGLYELTRDEGAHFIESSSWEAPAWYATNDPKFDDVSSSPRSRSAQQHAATLGRRLTWERPDWWPVWEREHTTIREGVAMIDMSLMAKYRLRGTGAGRAIDYISANSVNGEAGRVTYTQWLDGGGRIQADVTVSKLAADDFWIVATDTQRRHVAAHFERATGDASLRLEDVTEQFSQVNVAGPYARNVLSRLSSVDLSNAAFPFRTVRRLDVAGVPVTCMRVSYVGELTYELVVDAAAAPRVWNALRHAGVDFDIRPAGLKALGSCRLEKGFRDYGHDIDNTDHVDDAGLGFFMRIGKPGGFVGEGAVVAHRASADFHRKRVIQVQCCDPQALLYHSEPLLRDGDVLGYVRSASYGFTVGGAVGLAQVQAPRGRPLRVDDAFLSTGHWQVDVGGRKYDARVSSQSLYDPTHLRARS